VYTSAATPIGIVQGVRWLRSLAAFFFLAFGLLLWAEEADARLAGDARFADGKYAIGWNQPALAAHQEEISPCAVQPAYPAGSLGGLFNRPGMIGGFAAGFLGAGIFGFLFGHGVIGELSGAPSILGLIFQFALLLALGWAIRVWWRADKAAAVAQLSPRQLADAYERARNQTLPEFAADANARPKVDGKNSFADEAHLPQ
jgi:predicted lipid-binding transport protein (Tim44 family)